MSTSTHTQPLLHFSQKPLVSFEMPTACINSNTAGVRYDFIFKDFIYLLLERGEGKEKERDRNINVWVPLMCPLLGTWPATQACALTRNRSSDPLVSRPALSPLSHTSQGAFLIFWGISILLPTVAAPSAFPPTVHRWGDQCKIIVGLGLEEMGLASLTSLLLWKQCA